MLASDRNSKPRTAHRHDPNASGTCNAAADLGERTATRTAQLLEARADQWPLRARPGIGWNSVVCRACWHAAYLGICRVRGLLVRESGYV